MLDISGAAKDFTLLDGGDPASPGSGAARNCGKRYVVLAMLLFVDRQAFLSSMQERDRGKGGSIREKCGGAVTPRNLRHGPGLVRRWLAKPGTLEGYKFRAVSTSGLFSSPVLALGLNAGGLGGRCIREPRMQNALRSHRRIYE
ncbi:hypothetical protein Daesc_004761 [Daldinia eschscholtzii]|uniref:Uncharacterized protein n=1 Tax=Daldinia eschscholtzii TaxID=292717 RepID=A0AAX6MRJ2_9PEZI